MKKGLNPLAALIAAIFLITLAWAANFHPVAFVFLAIFTGGVLTHDNEEDLLYIKRELDLKKAIIEDLEQKLNPVSEAQIAINKLDNHLSSSTDQLQKINDGFIKIDCKMQNDDFKKLLRIAAIADKRRLGLFDKAELHKILEKYTDADYITTK